MQFIRVVLTCVVLLLAAAARVYAQAPLDVARDLYATADYEKALGLLDDLIARNDAGEKRQEAELYRALCFLALGQREDADRAVEAIVQRDPLYRAPDDIAPRMRTAFADVRESGAGKPAVLDRLLWSVERVAAATANAHRRTVLADEAARWARSLPDDYERAGPYWHHFRGLERYWRKRREAAAT